MIEHVRTFKWQDRRTWPENYDGQISLAEAVVRVGRARFADKWSGFDLAPNIPAKLPDWAEQEQTGFGDRWRVHRLLTESRRFDDLPAFPQSWKQGHPIPSFTQAHWEVAEELDDRFRANQTDRLRQSESVAREIVRAAAAAKLMVYLRPILGGPFEKAEPAIWYTERFWDWFKQCVLNPYALYEHVDQHVEFDLTETNQSKVEEIQKFIDQEWSARQLPDSEKLRSAMATMLREPASQLGRAKKSTTKG